MNAADQVLYDHLEMQAGWLGMRTPEQASVDVSPKDGDRLQLGDVDLHVLHTPGHTPAVSRCGFRPANTLVSGDTLFRDSIGRTDLPGGNTRQILASIHSKLLTLPEETAVIAGHGSDTTIGREKEAESFSAVGGYLTSWTIQVGRARRCST